MSIVDTIHLWAKTLPHRPAIIQTEMVTTYQGLADAIESIGERIDRLNLSRREPVAVCLANPSFFLAAIFALLHRGYDVAPVTKGHYPHLSGAGVRNLIYDTEGQVTSGGRNIRFDMSWLPELRDPGVPRNYKKNDGEDRSIIFFTSGTTGLPKKIVEPSTRLEQLLKNPLTRIAAAYQKVLIMPGLASGFGFNRTCEAFNLGKTACFAPDALSALSLINLFSIEVVIASTAQALGLAAEKSRNPGYRTDSVRTILSSGSKIEPEGIAKIQSWLCRNIVDFYSSTEAGWVASTVLDSRAGMTGATIMPGTDVQIVDETGRELPAQSEGMVRIRSPYLRENIKGAGTNEIPGVRDGWFYPGDLGFLDDAGLLHLAGRSTDVLNRGGVKVSGTRMATVLKERPEIADAAACNIAGPSGLQEIWLALVTDSDVNIDDIKNYLQKHQDIGIAPDRVFIVEQIPRGSLGKIQLEKLKELLLKSERGR